MGDDKKTDDGMPDFSDVQSGASSTAEAAKAYEIYEVNSGDSLSRIAKHEYGDAQKWPKIYEANRSIIKDPDLIYPGQQLRIPAAEKA